ncbi:MAG: TatD family nuclease-associated radical SAM protein [Oscillospiraceae bacterium]|jgi:TatD family-associated radical SAM protein|nr:TatD family nuclease-associated radical SAM protein [Oscillospiraceae bacterium]
MSDILYFFGGSPYLNITNQCPCACAFCIRNGGEGVGTAKNLWHDSDPTWDAIKKTLESCDFSRYRELAFCGYGEPFCQLENLKKAAVWLKEHAPRLELRVNTNGLGDLIHGRAVAAELRGLIHTVSISLNAPNAVRYDALCRSVYALDAFPAVLQFAADCKKIYPRVILSIVDVLSPAETEECRVIADDLGLPLRVRLLAD